MVDEAKRDLKKRTRKFAVEVLKVVQNLPTSQATHIISGQLIRSAGSAGCNFRSSQRPRSTADMIAKLKIVEEELDESMYWMEVLVEAELSPKSHLKAVYMEANELLAITVASIKSLRSRVTKVSEAHAFYGEDPDSPFST